MSGSGTTLTVLWNASLIDGRGSTVQERMVVTIAGGRIANVEKASGDVPPEGALDLGGRTLMPGLIDAHFHPGSPTPHTEGFAVPPALKGEEQRRPELAHYALAKGARALLEMGVTTIRDVGPYVEDGGIILREAIALGLVEGPRILSCGRIISATSPGGAIFGTMYREADGPDDMRRAVREQLRRGADFVKFMATGARSVVREDPERAQMTEAEANAIVDEAHRVGVRVTAHAEGLEGVRLALDAGVDCIEHGLSLHRDPKLLDRMAESGITLVPTLTTFHDLSERFANVFAPVLVEQAKRQKEEAYLTLAAARAAGVTLAMGYDSGPPGTNALELVRLVEGGIGNLEGISAATRGSATAVGIADEVGTVEPGKVADLIVLDGDPSQDVRVLTDPTQIWIVLQAGSPVAGQAFSPEVPPALAHTERPWIHGRVSGYHPLV